MASVREHRAGPLAGDYSSVTEVPGVEFTREALQMAYSRYAFAASYCQEKDVFEIACGAGPGLGLLCRQARRLIAGDFTEDLLARAARHYRGRVPLVRLDAQRLPCRADSFDVVVLSEALYYLPDANAFFRECRRVLRPSGRLILSTVNRRWRDFNPSPFSTRYYGLSDLSDALGTAGFDTELFGGFSTGHSSWLSSVRSQVKRSAIAIGVMPRTMKGKRLLKRLFLGPLVPAPSELRPDETAFDEPVPIRGRADGSVYKIIYAVARAR